MNRFVRLSLVSAVAGGMVLLLFLVINTDTHAHLDSSTIRVPDDKTTIQAAIDVAVDGDTILVASGVYTENNFITTGITLSGGWDSLFTTRTPGDSIINGDFQGRVISITCATSDTQVIIDGFTIKNGDASGLGASGLYAGHTVGILPHETFAPSSIQSDDIESPSEQATELRAGLADLVERDLYPGGQAAFQATLERLEWRTSQAESARLIVENNQGVAFDQPEQGGGIGGGVFSWNCSLRLVNNTIENNLASQDTHGVGGGIYIGNTPQSGVYISNNLISENVGCLDGEGSGGGMYLFQTPGAVLTYNVVQGNHASINGDGDGGGLSVQESPGVHFSDNEFLDNLASMLGNGMGGGLYISQSSGVIVEDGVFCNNLAADAGEFIQGFGGGLMVDSSSDIIVQNNEIERNTANAAWQYGVGSGGGLFLSNVDGAMVSENAIRDNLAALRGLGEGGGLTLFHTEDIRVEDNEVIGNWASFYQADFIGVGGGIAMDSVYSSTLIANEIRENIAVVYEDGIPQGGGIAGSGLGGQTQITGNSISANVSCLTGQNCEGGGIGIDGAQNVSMTDNELTNNTASLEAGCGGAGGGLYLADTEISQVLQNRFQGNRSGDTMDSSGGALSVNNYERGDGFATIDANLFLDNQPGGCDIGVIEEVLFTNNVIANSKISATGGLGLYLVQKGKIINNTIVDNGYYGIVADESSTFTMVNNIVGNHAFGLVVSEGVTGTVSYTLWHDNDTDISNSGVITHTHPITGDPAFIDPANHDYHLSFWSAARDAGDPAGVPPAPDHDLDGVIRPQGLAVDLGAYEYEGYSYYFFPLVVKNNP